MLIKNCEESYECFNMCSELQTQPVFQINTASMLCLLYVIVYYKSYLYNKVNKYTEDRVESVHF